MNISRSWSAVTCLSFASLVVGAPPAAACPVVEEAAVVPATLAAASLGSKLAVGDVVFIRIGGPGPFREVAAATGSWTNHVGVVVDVAGEEPLVAESAVPFSRITPLSRFVARSQGGHVAVRRLAFELTPLQRQSVVTAAHSRLGVLYDTGFDLHSHRQFCSRYVREVLLEATGHSVGEVETFATLLTRQPGAKLGFWRAWYFGRIPWQRETVTPASVLASAELRPVFDGTVTRPVTPSRPTPPTSR